MAPTRSAAAPSTLRPRDVRGLAGTRWLAAPAAAAAFVVVVLGIYARTAADAVSTWNTATYSYIYIVLPVSLYFLWSRRERVGRIEPRADALGVVVAVLSALIWLLGHAAGLAVAEQLAVVGMIQAVLLATLGRRIIRALLFPFLYLWLLAPVGGFLVPVLQEITTRLTVLGLILSGISVAPEGNVIDVPGARYVVVEACAGLSFLLGGLAYSLVYANLLYRGWRKRTIYVAAVLAAAVLANGFRAYSIVAWNYWTGDTIEIAGAHLQWGWAILALIVLIMMAAGWPFRDAAQIELQTSRDRRLPTDARAGAWRPIVAGAAAVLAAASAQVYAATWPAGPDDTAVVGLCLPDPASPWRRQNAVSGWSVAFPGAHRIEHRSYAREDRRADMAVAYYLWQDRGRELVSASNRLADGLVWSRMGARRRPIDAGGEIIDAGETRLRSGRRRRLVWHWYWVGGHSTGSPLYAKLLQARARLLRGDPRAALIAISVQETAGPSQAQADLRTFLASLPALGEALSREQADPAFCGRPG